MFHHCHLSLTFSIFTNGWDLCETTASNWDVHGAKSVRWTCSLCLPVSLHLHLHPVKWYKCSKKYIIYVIQRPVFRAAIIQEYCYCHSLNGPYGKSQAALRHKKKTFWRKKNLPPRMCWNEWCKNQVCQLLIRAQSRLWFNCELINQWPQPSIRAVGLHTTARTAEQLYSARLRVGTVRASHTNGTGAINTRSFRLSRDDLCVPGLRGTHFCRPSCINTHAPEASGQVG